MSKIQKESNSQHSISEGVGLTCCCDICQRYKKKAIHNCKFIARARAFAVAIYVKDTKRKQFTTRKSDNSHSIRLLRYMSKIQKESNSQRVCELEQRSHGCCDICQRYKKKAIHNGGTGGQRLCGAVAIYVKDTKRKQFTTSSWAPSHGAWLLRYMSKIQKESNSQHDFTTGCVCAKFAQLFKVEASWTKFDKVGFL